MNFLIADTFTASFNRLSGLDQKAVKASVFDLQLDPTGNGLQLHRIDKSKDPNFWSARVNRAIRGGAGRACAANRSAAPAPPRKTDRKSTRLNSSTQCASRMPSFALNK